MYKIEKNVPMPAAGTINTLKYPINDMQVGDSFAVLILNNNASRLINSLRSYCTRVKPDYKFSMRIDRDKDEVRVWRIK